MVMMSLHSYRILTHEPQPEKKGNEISEVTEHAVSSKDMSDGTLLYMYIVS